MSVLLDFSIFPVDQGSSVSGFVAPVIAMIRDSGLPYRLTPMGTVVETEQLAEALDLIARAHAILDALGCGRVYATAKLDIQRDRAQRIDGKIASVRRLIGEVQD